MVCKASPTLSGTKQNGVVVALEYLTTSLVNVSLNFQTLISDIRQYFLSKKL